MFQLERDTTYWPGKKMTSKIDVTLWSFMISYMNTAEKVCVLGKVFNCLEYLKNKLLRLRSLFKISILNYLFVNVKAINNLFINFNLTWEKKSLNFSKWTIIIRTKRMKTDFNQLLYRFSEMGQRLPTNSYADLLARSITS